MILKSSLPAGLPLCMASFVSNSTTSAYHRLYVEAVDPDLVSLWVSQKTISFYFQVATLTVLAYDAVITIDREVKYFWKGPWKTVNFVYFANRYVGIFGSASYLYWQTFGVGLHQCKFARWSSSFANWTTIVLIDYILSLRVLALYSQDKRLSLFLMTLLALEASSKLGILIYLNILQHIAVASLAKGLTACGYSTIPPWQWGLANWTIPLAYGTFLIILAVYKAVEYWKLSAGFKGFKLIKVIIQDQIFYFILAVSTCIVNIVEYKVQISNNFAASILIAFGNPAFLCVLGSRVLFNLKQAAEWGQNGGTNYRVPTKTLSGMNFDVCPLQDEGASMEMDFRNGEQRNGAQISHLG